MATLKRTISKAGRERIAAAQRARWARVRTNRRSTDKHGVQSYVQGAISQLDGLIVVMKSRLDAVEKARNVLVTLDRIAKAA